MTDTDTEFYQARIRQRQAARARRRRQAARRRIAGAIGLLLLLSLLLYFYYTTRSGAADCEADSTETLAAAETVSDTAQAAEAAVLEEAVAEVPDLTDLSDQLESMLTDAEGVWSIYVEDLGSGAALSIGNQSLYAASLIKLFVMADSFANEDEILSRIQSGEGVDADSAYDIFLENITEMIVSSDNEAYNELVRLHSDARSFTEGCLAIQAAIQTAGYADTGIYHTLSPSSTPSEMTEAKQNQTSVEDCAALLRSIYNGTCVSQEASDLMLSLLTQQETVTKIPAGVPEGITVANKTGETSSAEHDAAIVFGEQTDYILCVMSSEITALGNAQTLIKEISETVYTYLNS